MKKWIFMLACSSLAVCLHAQDTFKNIANSAYFFEKVVEHNASSVRNQCRTSTCWSFSTLSFLESEILRTKNLSINLSEMWVVRHTYLEKAIMYLRMDGDHRFDEGAELHDAPLIIEKYGIVQEQDYPGLKYKQTPGDTVHNHNELKSVLLNLLNTYKTQMQKGELSPLWKESFNAILDVYLGKLPTQTTVAGKTYKPTELAQYLDIKASNYVNLTSFIHQPMYKSFVLEIPDNWSMQSAYNVPLNEFSDIAIQSLKSGYTFAWAADVSEPGFSFKNGLAILPDSIVSEHSAAVSKAKSAMANFTHPGKEISVSADLRQWAYDYKKTTDDHGMHITGLYKDQYGQFYFKMKNSWGTSNYGKGYQMVSLPYFQMKTIAIIVNKNSLSAEMRKKLNLL